ncbi:thiamine pyrophosphate-requiring protein [Caenispirillum bisanense]|uniref:Pyruvate dehydrogenase (Quinone) n=1 Tax=Caenispirillum bisanense TaxID=414052 RepID=A0A286GW51_9PROT|nr:thiamine pyrophosphate-requiring protein [Caenispirillum bisanense]SOD99768.1 pyruvate dehydrogenase (quinone) [Caenispirillum bisanense]
MASTVSDFFWERVHQWGIKRIFGYPGDGINALVAALDRQEDKFEFVQARHEELSSFMATAHAKFTGEVGVCLATSGPGAVHLLTGLYDAKLDHTPVVAIVGQQARMALGGHYQQEIDLETLFADVSGFCQRVDSPAQVRHVIDRAFRIAMSERTVATIILPKDVQEQPAVEKPPRAHGAIHSGVGYRPPRVLPAEADLREAADIINAGKRVAILVGQGSRGARQEVIELAEKTGGGVAKALLGRDVLPDTLPFVTGSIGLLGTRPSYDLMEGCDTLIMIGSGFPYSEWLPEEGKAKGVQIDIDASMLSLRYPMDVPLCGDAQDTLEALLPMIEPKSDRSWRADIEKGIEKWWQTLEARAMNDADPINPQRVFWELSPRLPDNCVISGDSGSSTNWFARDLKIRDGMRASLSGGLATMGPGVPYAIAAKYAWPDRPVIACVGDGAMQMNGINGLITIAHCWKKWRDPRLMVLVLNNQDLNQVTWEMRAQDGDPKFETTQSIPDFPYARYADLIGLKGFYVDRPEQIAETLDAALAHPGPTVVEVKTDPEVPPLPPHIRFKNAKAFLSSLWSGDPEAGGMVRQSVKEMVVDLLPNRKG